MTQPMKHQRVSPASPLDQGTWQQILTAAKALFFAKGYKGVSMKEIADAVQVMPSALYYHFPKGKEDLFTKMIQTLFVDEGVAGIDQAMGTTLEVNNISLSEALSGHVSRPSTLPANLPGEVRQ